MEKHTPGRGVCIRDVCTCVCVSDRGFGSRKTGPRRAKNYTHERAARLRCQNEMFAEELFGLTL